MRVGIRHSFSVGGYASAGYAEDGGATGFARGAPQNAPKNSILQLPII